MHDCVTEDKIMALSKVSHPPKHSNPLFCSASIINEDLCLNSRCLVIEWGFFLFHYRSLPDFY